jgi:hypothetical protein
MPDGATINEIQVKVLEVYPRKENVGQYNKSVQNATVGDGAGNKIKISVWEHPDLTPLKGKELILHSSKNGAGKFGGVSVKHGSYPSKTETLPDGTPKPVKTVELSVGKSGQFQLVEVYHQSQGTSAPVVAPASTTAGSYQQVHSTAINGQTVGMAINNAIKILVDGGSLNPETLERDLIMLGSKIIRASQTLERGEIVPKAKETVVDGRPAQETPVDVTHKPRNPPPDNLDEDVPF